MQKIRKAIIPAAGLGTRFLPATKAQPKEMLPIVDKPAIQFIIEEAIASGIEEILIITGRNKRSIEDHFDRSLELEMQLKAQGKYDLLGMIEEISNITIHFIRQKEARGLGHAVLCARQFVGNEPLRCCWAMIWWMPRCPAWRSSSMCMMIWAAACWECRRCRGSGYPAMASWTPSR